VETTIIEGGELQDEDAKRTAVFATPVDRQQVLEYFIQIDRGVTCDPFFKFDTGQNLA
jgi:hypothetical protein